MIVNGAVARFGAIVQERGSSLQVDRVGLVPNLFYFKMESETRVFGLPLTNLHHDDNDSMFVWVL